MKTRTSSFNTRRSNLLAIQTLTWKGLLSVAILFWNTFCLHWMANSERGSCKTWKLIMALLSANKRWKNFAFQSETVALFLRYIQILLTLKCYSKFCYHMIISCRVNLWIIKIFLGNVTFILSVIFHDNIPYKCTLKWIKTLFRR